MRKDPKQTNKKKKYKKNPQNKTKQNKKTTEPQSRVSGKVTPRAKKAEPNTGQHRDEAGDAHRGRSGCSRGEGTGHARSEGTAGSPRPCSGVGDIGSAPFGGHPNVWGTPKSIWGDTQARWKFQRGRGKIRLWEELPGSDPGVLEGVGGGVWAGCEPGFWGDPLLEGSGSA